MPEKKRTMRVTNSHSHDIGISSAIEDVAELRAVGDSLCDNGTPIVGDEQEVLGACESASQGAIGGGSVHLDQCSRFLFCSFSTQG